MWIKNSARVLNPMLIMYLKIQPFMILKLTNLKMFGYVLNLEGNGLTLIVGLYGVMMVKHGINIKVCMAHWDLIRKRIRLLLIR